MHSTAIKDDGFTLIEVLIAIAVFSVVVGAAYTLFSSQQRSHNTQLAVVDAQQELRAGLGLMARDIRLAGYDECFGVKAGAGITVARADRLAFTMSIFDGFDGDGDGLIDEWDEAGSIAFDGIDNDGDGIVDGYDEIEWVEATYGINLRAIDDPRETAVYGFRATDDADGDGIADAGAAPFGRTDGDGVFSVLMENVHAVAFAYAYDDDDDGFLDTDAAGEIIWGVDSAGDGRLDTDLDGNMISPTVAVDQIRAVRVWVLARTSRTDNTYADSRTYSVGSTAITPGDSYRRRLLTATVLCRNMN